MEYYRRLSADYFINHEIRIPNKQPGLSMESKAVVFFFVASHIFDDGVTTRIHAPASRDEKNHSHLGIFCIIIIPVFFEWTKKSAKTHVSSKGPLYQPTCRQQWCEDSRLGLAGMAEMVVKTLISQDPSQDL